MALPRLSRLSYRNFATSARVNALSALARSKADQISAEWKGTSATGGTTKNLIGGEFIESKATVWHDVLDPVSLHMNSTLLLILMHLVYANITLQGPRNDRS